MVLVAAAWLPAPVTAAPADLDAQQVMKQVNARYTARIPESRIVTIHQTVTVSRADNPDFTEVSTLKAYLKGNKAKVEEVDGDLSAPFGPDRVFRGPSHLKSYWIHDGKQTVMVYETPPIADMGGKAVTKIVRVRNSDLPAELGQKYRAPLTSNEFDPVFLNAAFNVDTELLNGKPVIFLRSREPIRANANSVFEQVAFWIHPTDWELLRLEMTVKQTEQDPAQLGAQGAFVHTVQDLQTAWGAAVDDSLFVVDEGALKTMASGAGSSMVDITDDVARRAAAAKKP